MPNGMTTGSGDVQEYEEAAVTLLDRLRGVGCDRKPFTPDHAVCVCRLANEAADEIEKLHKLLSDVDTTMCVHGKVDAGTDLHDRIQRAYGVE